MKRDSFKEALCDAAASAERPFSDELHVRVMAGVRRERAGKGGEMRWGGWWAVGVVAAGVVVVVGVWALRPGEPVRERPVVAVGPMVSSLKEAIRETAEPVREELHDARYAYLDRDGKRLAKFLWRSVPGVSLAGKGEGGEERQ